jgi:hypothetical protein
MEIMPQDIRDETIGKLETLISKHQLVNYSVINTRKSTEIDQSISSSAFEYLEFLKNYTVPSNVEQLRIDLVKFLKSFETLHKNSILDYAPRYEEFLRRIGY